MAYSLSYSKSILVLVFIADKIRRGETDYLSAKVISELLDIPRPTLVVMFNNFIRAGILESKEGINGGVRFARAAEQITLLDILLAIEQQKPLFHTRFDIKASGSRPDAVRNKLTETLVDVEQRMKLQLAGTTLKDILDAS